MAAASDEYLGPNISSNRENFFQTDKDLELVKSKAEKAAKYGKFGDPIPVGSKVLSMLLTMNAFRSQKTLGEAIVCLSNFTAVRTSLDPNSTAATQVFKGHTGPVTCAAVQYSAAYEGLHLFTGSWDKSIKKWDLRTGECVATLLGHGDFVKCVTIFRDTLYSGSSDGTLRKWNISTGECLATLKEHTRSVEDVLVDEAGEFLYTASSDTTIKKWDMSTDAVVADLNGHLSSVYSLAIVDNVLYSCSADKTAKRWNLDTCKVEASYEHPDFVKCSAVQNQYLFTGCRDESIRVFDTNTNKLVLTFEGHLDEVSCLKVVPHSKLYSGSLDGTIRQWPLDGASLQERIKEFAVSGKKRATKLQPKEDHFQAMTKDEEAELAELMD